MKTMTENATSTTKDLQSSKAAHTARAPFLSSQCRRRLHTRSGVNASSHGAAVRFARRHGMLATASYGFCHQAARAG